MLLAYFRSKARRESVKGDSGVYLLVVAATLFVLIAAFCIAIDAGNLYWTKRKLQTVVDSAAIAASRLVIQKPEILNGPDGIETMKNYTRELMEHNLDIMGFSQSEIDGIFRDGQPAPAAPVPDLVEPVDAQGNNVSQHFWIGLSDLGQTIQIYLHEKEPTLILGAIPFYSKANSVRAYSRANNQQINAVLVFDASDSMIDQIPNPPASCSDGRKLCAAKYAANDFMNMLLPFDRVAAVTFATDYGDAGLQPL